MHAFTLRRERYGDPREAFAREVVPVPGVRPGHVLVCTMAAGIDYNDVWAAQGHPVDVIAMREKAGAEEDYHIGGSGVVWAVGEGVRGVAVGDHVVIAPGQWDEGAETSGRAATPSPRGACGCGATRTTSAPSASSPSCGTSSATPSPRACPGTWRAASR